MESARLTPIPIGFPTVTGTAGVALVVALLWPFLDGGGREGVLLAAAIALPVARALREVGNRVVGVLGARSRDHVILEDEFREAADHLLVATDDGSYGRDGFVTDALADLLVEEPVALVHAVGPIPMMHAVADLTRGAGVPTVVEPPKDGGLIWDNGDFNGAPGTSSASTSHSSRRRSTSPGTPTPSARSQHRRGWNRRNTSTSKPSQYFSDSGSNTPCTSTDSERADSAI